MSILILIAVYALGGVGFICTLLLAAALIFGRDVPSESQEERIPPCALSSARPVRRGCDAHPVAGAGA